MKTLALVLFAFATVSTSARAGEWKPPTPVEWAALAPVATLIAYDVQTTVEYCRANPTGTCEANPLLGRHPSTAHLYVGGGAALLGTALAYYVLPSPWRYFLAAGVGGAEIGVNLNNRGMTLGWHF